MDNNKIVENLNFIKIYFRVFIYKIIVPKKAWISRKEMKNHRLRMKTCLGVGTKSKNLRKRVQNALEHGRTFGVQEPIRHFWSAEWHFNRAEFPLFGLWPNTLRVTIRNTIFDFFAKWCIWIHILIVRAYFLESFGLYK